MKKKFLLFSAFAALSTLVLSSYSGGPAHGGAGNRTGSAGTTANCSTGGCHAANTTATMATIIVGEIATPTTPITSYVAGRTYAISVGGVNTSSALSKFGFQISSVRSSNTSAQAGSWGVGSATNIMAVTSGGLSIMEHMAVLNGLGSGIYGTTFQWTAPAAGAGAVKFFAMVNIVNANNSTSGDAPNSATLELPQATTSVGNVAQTISLKAYPSPAVNTLQLEVNNTAARNFDIKVTDMAGRIVLQDKMTAQQHGLDVSMLSSGQYIVTIGANGAQGSVRFSK